MAKKLFCWLDSCHTSQYKNHIQGTHFLYFRGTRKLSNQQIYKIFLFFQRRKVLDANRYATKKTIAQGMLDVALLTANASQLKYVLQVGEEKHEFYHLMLALIIISIVLQVNIHEDIKFLSLNSKFPKTK